MVEGWWSGVEREREGVGCVWGAQNRTVCATQSVHRSSPGAFFFSFMNKVHGRACFPVFLLCLLFARECGGGAGAGGVCVRAPTPPLSFPLLSRCRRPIHFPTHLNNTKRTLSVQQKKQGHTCVCVRSEKRGGNGWRDDSPTQRQPVCVQSPARAPPVPHSRAVPASDAFCTWWCAPATGGCGCGLRGWGVCVDAVSRGRWGGGGLVPGGSLPPRRPPLASCAPPIRPSDPQCAFRGGRRAERRPGAARQEPGPTAAAACLREERPPTQPTHASPSSNSTLPHHSSRPCLPTGAPVWPPPRRARRASQRAPRPSSLQRATACASPTWRPPPGRAAPTSVRGGGTLPVR